LSRVCVDKNCNNKTLICCICEDEQHKGHQTTPLKNFLIKLNASTDGFNSINPLYYSNKIEQLRASFLSSIANQKARIVQAFSDLEVQSEIYFNKVSQMTMSMVSMGNITNVLNEQSTNPKTVKSYFSKLMKLVDFESKETFNLKKQLEAIVDSCKDK
jgi:hypothetical protein